MLRKIRRRITKNAAISLYKQMILPLFDYSGFLLLACNMGQTMELQRIQNSCIRTCLSYNHDEHITIDHLHGEMRVISLEQRRRIQCLKLMYRLSKKTLYIKPVNVNTRGNVKKKFKLLTKCTSKYLNSPLYVGAALGDNLDKNVQDMPTQKLFAHEITKCREYMWIC